MEAAPSELLAQVAFTTECFVDIRPTHNHLLVWWTLTAIRKETRSSIGTYSTKGGNAFHSVCQGDAFQEFSKRATMGIPVKSYQKEMTSRLFHHPFHEWN